MTTDDKQLSPQPHDCKTVSVPVAGKRYYDLAKNAAYAAARRGNIPTIRVGGKLRVPIVAMERKLDAAGR